MTARGQRTTASPFPLSPFPPGAGWGGGGELKGQMRAGLGSETILDLESRPQSSANEVCAPGELSLSESVSSSVKCKEENHDAQGTWRVK